MGLNQELKSKIREFGSEKPESIALKAKRHPDLPMAFIARQVKARARIEKKLPSWHANEDIEFPDTLALEQCSSEAAAEYKAALLEGESLADLTGGLGVDTVAFARRFPSVCYLERDEALASLARRNFAAWRLDGGIETIHDDGVAWLRRSNEKLDWIYLDPARRDGRGLKVSSLGLCRPDVGAIWTDLLASGNRVAVKLSPGLDIDSILQSLSGIYEIHVVSVGNECKECLCLAEMDFQGPARIVCSSSDAAGHWSRFSFRREDERALPGRYGRISRFLYEPNASIMKAGGFKSLGEERGLKMLHPRTRFYTSDKLIVGFPGRVFEVLETGRMQRRTAVRLFPDGQANVLARNAGLSSVDLKTKLGMRDGGPLFAIGTTDVSDSRRLLKCARIDNLDNDESGI